MRNLLGCLAVVLAIAAGSAAQAHDSDYHGKSLLPLPRDEAPPPGGFDDDELLYGLVTRGQEATIVDRAYPKREVEWPSKVILVCWEDLDPQFAEERALVQAAIEDTWLKHSQLKVAGAWDKCNPGGEGIRIQVADEGPHVKALGKDLNKVVNGMILNFTYNNWGKSFCQPQLDFCNRAIAVHEFGHAIGFAHEQNRPDTPGECNEPKQGSNGDTILMTPWDLHSVMNYCNPEYANNGQLSEFDIVAVQYIYGVP